MRTVKYPRIARFLAVTLSLSLPGTACLAAGNDDITQDRIDSVGRLVSKSSAARKVIDSGDPNALAKHREAQSLHAAAQAAYRDDDLAGAKELIAKATRAMFEAAHIADQGGDRMQKQQDDFAARLSSVNALLTAYERIVVEKGADERSAGETRASIAAKVDEAQSLEKQQKLDRAREVLDQAYLSAKLAIEQLRGGDTLVRHLNFASKEEEYNYEVDRNDTHRMLVDILLQEKLSKSNGVQKLVQQFMTKAGKLRSQAEAQAADGAYDAAVETLELSTREIVRAIRSAGVYIPG
jgi:hypothetical protein